MRAAKVILSPQRATGATAHRAKYAGIKENCVHEISKIGFRTHLPKRMPEGLKV